MIDLNYRNAARAYCHSPDADETARKHIRNLLDDLSACEDRIRHLKREVIWLETTHPGRRPVIR